MRKLVIVLIVVAALMAFVVPVASAHPAFCESGRAFGQFHAELAQREGPMGQTHRPGIAHTGFSSCLASH